MMASAPNLFEHDHPPDSSASRTNIVANAHQIADKHSLPVATSHISGHICAEKHASHSKEREEVEMEVGSFDCNICIDLCRDPVVTMCGHLFCWSCLYSWLSLYSTCQECPVCKANVQDKVVPLYGRGRVETAGSLAKKFPHIHIPCRPSAMLITRGSVAIPHHEFHTGQSTAGSAHLGIPASQPRFRLSSTPTYNGGFFFHRWGRNAAASLPAGQRAQFSNEKVFVLHWVFICVALLTAGYFFVC